MLRLPPFIVIALVACAALNGCRSVDMTVLDSFKADIGHNSEGQVASVSVHNILFNDSHTQTLIQFSEMKRLYLINTSVTDVGMKNIGELQNLKLINISNGKISQRGVARLEHMKHLQELILEDNPMIRDPVVVTLKRMTSLRYLNLRGTTIKLQTIQQLQKDLPDCLIEF